MTILTRHHGKVDAVAKGVRKTSSRFGARLEPFTRVDVLLYRGRNLDTVTEVVSLAAYGSSFVGDYDAYTAACAMVELADDLSEYGEPDESHYLLLVSALASLARREHDAQLIMDSYILRALRLSGWEMSVSECANCGRSDDLVAFSERAGGVLCSQCAPHSAPRINDDERQLMVALLAGSWKDTAQAGIRTLHVVTSYINAYTVWQLEAGLKSLRVAALPR